jgi:hypothetical protein
MTMFKRIGVVLLAVTIWSFCLELGEKFAIPACRASSPPQRPSSAAP